MARRTDADVRSVAEDRVLGAMDGIAQRRGTLRHHDRSC